MLIKTPRKVLGIPIDDSATSYHRVIQPLHALREEGHPVQFLGKPEEQLAQYEWAEVIYTQCLYTPDAFKFYHSQKQQGKYLIVDFDDDYINIPVDSPEQTEVIDKQTGERYQFSPQLRAVYVKLFIQLADLVVVTTDALKHLYAPFAKQIVVIPNCVSAEMMRDYPKEINQITKILWSGSASHLPDLELLQEPLRQINQKYKEKVEFHFQGPLSFKEIFPDLPIVEHSAVSFGEYLNVIQAINPDIALGPLKTNAFNAAKSNLKYLQMTLMEAAFVSSNFGPYTNIDHEFDGMHATNTKSWVDAISKLIDNEKLRLRVVSNALTYVKAHCMLEKKLDRWRNILSF